MRVVPIKTSIEDMEKLIGYINKQIGWVEVAKLQKSLGATAVDDRKIAAMVGLGLLQRDGGNLKITDLGKLFAGGDQATALRAAMSDNELYRSTIEWLHYSKKAEATAADIGQYWESHHKDTLGDLKGTTLKDGAVCFGRIADGAGFGIFKVGRAGKETRFSSDLASIAAFLDGEVPVVVPPSANGEVSMRDGSAVNENGSAADGRSTAVAAPAAPVVTVSASPNVHVNVEIHIAADATAETVSEIFRNMARYVLDKHFPDDDVN